MSSQAVSIHIRELRQRHNMTQAELANAAGLSQATVSNLESGKLRRIELETIAKLCRTLLCTPNDLFGLPTLSNEEIVRRQKHALSDLIGSIKYDQAFNADDLDSDLAAITDRELTESSRVAENVTTYRRSRKGKRR